MTFIDQMMHLYSIRRSKWHIDIVVTFTDQKDTFILHYRPKWYMHMIFPDHNDTHFLESFTSLPGKGGWKPELLCPNIMLQHPESRVIAAAVQPPPAPIRSVIWTAPVSLAMAKSPPQWSSVWPNKSFVRGAVNSKNSAGWKTLV